MVFFFDIQDLYSTRRRYDNSSGATYNGHVIPPGRGGDRSDTSQSITTKTIENTVGGGSHPAGTGATTTHIRGPGDSFEQITVETTRSLQSEPPRRGQYAIDTEYTVNAQGEMMSKDGKIIGRQLKSGESYGMREESIFNDKGEMISPDGRIIGRSPKQGERFGIDTDFIITINGEYVTKDGKKIGRLPRSGDCTINDKGQYILKNGVILDYAPDSGEYIVNELGEFVTRDGKVIGLSLQGFRDGLVSSSETDVSGIATKGISCQR